MAEYQAYLDCKNLRCQRAILLDRGKVMADGPVRTILADPVLMEKHGLEVPHSLTPHVEKHHNV